MAAGLAVRTTCGAVVHQFLVRLTGSLDQAVWSGDLLLRCAGPDQRSGLLVRRSGSPVVRGVVPGDEDVQVDRAGEREGASVDRIATTVSPSCSPLGLRACWLRRTA